MTLPEERKNGCYSYVIKNQQLDLCYKPIKVRLKSLKSKWEYQQEKSSWKLFYNPMQILQAHQNAAFSAATITEEHH